MPKYSRKGSLLSLKRVEYISRCFLLALYYCARVLGLLSARLERNSVEIVPIRRRRNRILQFLFRAWIIVFYAGVTPHLFYRSREINSYASLFVQLQSSSVSLFAVVSFAMQLRCEAQFTTVLNRYVQLFRRIASRTQRPGLFPLKFPLLCLMKLMLTIVGCFNEISPLFEMEHMFQAGNVIAALFGVYMWLGTLYILDICFLGFLITGIMYDQMGTHIRGMLQRMQILEADTDDEGKRISQYMRMCALCDYADELDELSLMYAELYAVTKLFHRTFQWQIIFYIYYNFIVILLLLYECIFRYLETDQLTFLPLLMVAIKFSNLVLLIMCVDYAVTKSRMPKLLALDIICSDIDLRWDKSVTSFLAQQETQNFEIKVLGIFLLNNEFILLILSAIISYLFILIQFGLTGGFEASEVVQRQLSQH